MQPDKILQSDLLDIIFENRNKAYGAYTLRREYNARVYKAIAITFSASALLLLFSFNNKKTLINVPAVFIDSVFIRHVEIIPKVHPPASAKNGAATSIAKTTRLFPTRAVIVPTDEVIKIIPSNEEISKEGSGLMNTSPGAGFGASGESGTRGYGSDSISQNKGQQELNKNIVDDSPDILPEYPGGKNALKRFLERNLVHPSTDDEQDANVLVKFVVKFDGTISDLEIVQSGGSEFDQEVLRVVKKMPNWIPGKTKGQDVSVHYMIPVKFQTN